MILGNGTAFILETGLRSFRFFYPRLEKPLTTVGKPLNSCFRSKLAPLAPIPATGLWAGVAEKRDALEPPIIQHIFYPQIQQRLWANHLGIAAFVAGNFA